MQLILEPLPTYMDLKIEEMFWYNLMTALSAYML